MKKTVITIILFIVFLLIFFVQVNLFPSFTIAGVTPNLFIIFILFIGLYANQALGVAFGVITGLIIDSIYSQTIGVSAIMLCVIGYLGSYFDKNFSKDNKLTILFMVVGCTVIYETGVYFFRNVILDIDFEIWLFTKILLIEVLYNSLLSILLYPLIQKAGYCLDRNFKENNLLTRYF